MNEVKFPDHIAIIMDGNGRWAKKRGLPRSAGHREGAKKAGEISRYCSAMGLRVLTLFAFSTENWSRPQNEVDEIMNLLRRYLDEMSSKNDENIRLRIIGNRHQLSEDLQRKIENVEEKSEKNSGMTLNIALNYGGRHEIAEASKKLASDVMMGVLHLDEIDAAALEKKLDTAGLPDPDIILRPSGEKRLSNFLLWQCAYSEFIYMDVLWPDFTTHDLDSAIEEYMGRKRRFGGI
jgi:undecaprenyl diphosphate synthase